MPARDATRPSGGPEKLRLRSLGAASLDLIDATGASVDHQETSKALRWSSTWHAPLPGALREST